LFSNTDLILFRRNAKSSAWVNAAVSSSVSTIVTIGVAWTCTKLQARPKSRDKVVLSCACSAYWSHYR